LSLLTATSVENFARREKERKKKRTHRETPHSVFSPFRVCVPPGAEEEEEREKIIYKKDGFFSSAI